MEEIKKIKSDLRNISILIVEDGEDISAIMDRTFKMLVKDIYLAKNGNEAIEKYHKFAPDIILTDLRMPLLSGTKLLKKIREEDEEIPIIVITAYKKDLKEKESALATAVFEKPIDFMDLVKCIDAAVKERK